MICRQPLSILVPAAIFSLSLVRAASAHVATVDEVILSPNGVTIFDDTFRAGLTLAGGASTALRSGTFFPGGDSDGLVPTPGGRYANDDGCEGGGGPTSAAGLT